MKVKIGYEELWEVVLDGSGLHGDPIEVEVPDEVAIRCQKAQDEWEATIVILGEAYRKAKTKVA